MHGVTGDYMIPFAATLQRPLQRRLPMLLNGRTTPENCPSPWGFAPTSDTWFRAPTRVFVQNGMSIGSAAFAQLTVKCPITIQWAATFPLKLPVPIGGSDASSNTWYVGPPESLTQTASHYTALIPQLMVKFLPSI